MSPPAGVVDGLLAGRYRLASVLGSGANGEVWRARDERLDRDVAVKVLRSELTDDEGVRERFRAEARHAGRLRHPGIAAVFDFSEDDEGAWLVMELVDGQPLSEVLRHEGRLPVDRTLDVVEQAAAALHAAHDGGVVHRDVKPGNLLLRRDGRLSVTDFGIAHAAGAAALTRTGEVVGTASYLSPEQASGKPVSPATDLYALGVVAHECLSGRRPFERDDPVAVLLAHLQTPPPPLPADVPPAVADLVHRLMAKDPADRPASASQVQQEAAALRREAATAAPPTPVLPVAAVPPATAQPLASARPPASSHAGAPAARAATDGLAGRPGQRRAVRATAVALGLLALALGVRDALEDAPVSPAEVQQRPAGSAPAATQDTPTDQPQDQQQDQQQPQDAPVVVPEDEPQQPAPVQGEGQDEEADQQEQLEQQEEQRKELQRQQEEQRKELEQQRKEQQKQDEQERKEQRKDGARGDDG